MGGVIASHNRKSSARSYKNIVDQYGKRCQWLKNEKFLKDLEGDSVDTEILDEELRVLQGEEPLTCRGKTAKVLETSPVQIALCVLILVDAGIVITEILLDLHAMRSQQREAAMALHQTLDFLRYQYADDLSGYQGDNVQYILEKLRQKYKNASADGKTRTKRSLPVVLCFDDPTIASLHNAPSSVHFADGHLGLSDRLRQQWISYAESLPERDRPLAVKGGLDNANFHMVIRGRRHAVVPKSHKATAEKGTRLETGMLERLRRNKREPFSNEGSLSFLYNAVVPTNRQPASSITMRVATMQPISKLDSTDATPRVVHSYRHESAEAANEDVTKETSGSTGSGEAGLVDDDPTASFVNSYDGGHGSSGYTFSENAHAEQLLKIAHFLHFASIAILGVFVLQVFLKLFGMGSEFFKNKLELFDGIIILASFTLDLVFVEGISGAQGEEAIALLIIFLLWRILRVINGIMVTTKQRHEFRIKLQRRACRRAEKKIENLEEDISWKDKEIHTLKGLCLRNGVTEEDIESAQPKRRPVFSKMDTSSGLSSIASLSLGFTMSMRPPPPSGAATVALPHGFPPSPSSSSGRSQGTRSTSGILMRQQTIEEMPKHLRRTGTWCLAQRKTNQKELRPRGCLATQSLHMKRITEEGATSGPIRCVGVRGIVGATESVGSNGFVTDGVSSAKKDLSDVVAAADGDAKNADNCSGENPGVPLDQTNELNRKTILPRTTESVSDQDLEISSTISSTVPQPELASDPRDLCSEKEALHSAGVAAETGRDPSAPRCEDFGNCSSSSNQTIADQHPKQPPQCHPSLDGAVRWFPWKSTGNSHCSYSSCSSSSSVPLKTVDNKAVTAHVTSTPPPHLVRQTTHAPSSTASNKRSAWRNTFHHKKNETPPAANV